MLTVSRLAFTDGQTPAVCLEISMGPVGGTLLRQVGSAGAESVTARSSEVESPACRRKNEELDVTIMVRVCFSCQK